MAKLEESKIFPKDDEIFPFFEEVQSLSRILWVFDEQMQIDRILPNIFFEQEDRLLYFCIKIWVNVIFDGKVHKNLMFYQRIVQLTSYYYQI